MRQVLHLHAGFHKTGSTAIQGYLFHNPLGSDHSYFHNNNPNSSLIILQAFRQNLADYQQFQHENFTPEDVLRIQKTARNRIAEIIQEIDKTHTILSAESIGILNPAEHLKLYEFFKKYYKEIHVYIYIRTIKSRIESAYQEILKTRYRSLEQQFPVSFKKSIGGFDQAFGKNRVHVCKFSKAEFAGGDVVNHFLGQLGIARQDGQHSKDNTALSFPAIQLLYIYRTFFPTPVGGDNERIERLGSLPGAAMHFHSDLFEKLLSQDSGDTQWLEDRAGFSVTEDIEAYNDSAIRSERELTAISRESVRWLKEQQPDFRSRLRIRRGNLRSIAHGVRCLADAP